VPLSMANKRSLLSIDHLVQNIDFHHLHMTEYWLFKIHLFPAGSRQINFHKISK